MNESVNISVDKPSSLVDEVIIISVKGVEPHSLVTIVATLSDQARFYSYATYRASEYGEVDVSKTPSISGTYTGVEAMGLVWSMIQQPGQKPGRRLIKLDVTTPLVTTLAVFAGSLDGAETLCDDFREKHCLAACTCDRWYMAEGVERIPITDSHLHGTLFIPKGEGPFPGVLDLFGTAGGTIEHRSALMASRGIASLALCYYLPEVVRELEYFVSAVDYLLSHPQVSSHGAGVIGVSKGSLIAYLLAIICPKIYASVNISGTDKLYPDTHSFNGEIFHEDQEIVKAVAKAHAELKPEALVNFHFADLLADYLATNGAKATIPVERAKNTHFLIVHGRDDRCAPPEGALSVASRLRSHSFFNYTLVMYPNAGHLLEPPHAPHTYSSYHKYLNVHTVWGGKPKQHSMAQEDLWKRMQRFMHERIPLNANFSCIQSNL